VRAGAERQRASTTNTAALVGALGSVGTDLRRATAQLAPAEAGGRPTVRVGLREQGARGVGGVCDGQEQRASGAG
jgi:hypothetical protein